MKRMTHRGWVIAIILVVILTATIFSQVRNRDAANIPLPATLAPTFTPTLSPDQSLEVANQAIARNPNDAPAYFGRGIAYVALAFQQKEAAQQAQLARQAIADLRRAQKLGYTLPYDIELAVTQLEAQLGRPEITEPPES